MVAPSNPKQIYLLANFGGTTADYFYSSSNGGTSWNLTQAVNTSSSSNVVVDPANSLQVSITTYVGNNSPNGLMTSSDGGKTWTSSNPVPLLGAGELLTQIPGTPNGLVGSWGAHLWSTPDGGTTWTEADQGIVGFFGDQVATDPQNPQNVYLAASDGGGLFTSTDGGHTWANTHATNGCSAIAVDPITPEHLLASCDDDKDILQFSNDRGQTWNGLPLTIGSSTLEYIFLSTFDSNKQGTIYLGIFSRQRIRHCEIDRWWVFVGRYRQRASGPRSRRAFSRRSAIVRNFANGF